ncbi:peptidyl-tRNA hydrolase, PTH1 family [Prauserella marina]|uniref:Peptidyl-tRNA hydrolase n=1 Tax=Prauserella marina TaxID=530584 RepID=A0A1G6WMQ7_9PSEU|nr:aminoacyl-tRNA hydrolase [Prauserella marina]PWV73293.1 PTH1 family peptidyl-tRNA hydrolase [Prauserella marina]SDD67084.1 peptidyl-tRNA hydrolase, PTH1 family [Prauserella marina]
MEHDLPGAGEQVLLVGLGNPGPRYSGNRHNVGFLVLDELAARIGGKFKGHKGGADVLEGRVAGRKTVLAKPRSFMNLSGGPVAGTARFYKVDPSAIVVVHDELDVDFGALKLKFGGGDNGHNGLRSITKSLGTKDYYRVRFGVGRPPGRMDPADYVLKDFGTVERKELALNIDRCADAVEELLGKGLTSAQNTYHAG